MGTFVFHGLSGRKFVTTEVMEEDVDTEWAWRKMWDENVTRSISVVSSSEVEKRETSRGAFSDNITGENTTARFEMFILL